VGNTEYRNRPRFFPDVFNNSQRHAHCAAWIIHPWILIQSICCKDKYFNSPWWLDVSSCPEENIALHARKMIN